jgi:hypothetical protein
MLVLARRDPADQAVLHHASDDGFILMPCNAMHLNAMLLYDICDQHIMFYTLMFDSPKYSLHFILLRTLDYEKSISLDFDWVYRVKY